MDKQKTALCLSPVLETVVHTQGCRFGLITQAFFSSCELTATMSGTLFCLFERRTRLEKHPCNNAVSDPCYIYIHCTKRHGFSWCRLLEA